MKTKWLGALLLPVIVLAACDSETVAPRQDPNPIVNPIPGQPNASPDTIGPVARFSDPVKTEFVVIDRVDFDIAVVDDKALEDVLVLISGTEPGSATDTLLYASRSNNLIKGASFVNTLHLAKEERQLAANVLAQSYKLILLARDTANNAAKDSLVFKVHAPDLDLATFSTFAQKRSLFQALDWYGVSLPNDALSRLSLVLFHLIDKDWDNKIPQTDWEKYTADFNFGSLSWSAWDINNDGSLNKEEFKEGMKTLNLHLDWDKDRINTLTENELIAGFFASWDKDKNNRLSRAEYEDNFYTYSSF